MRLSILLAIALSVFLLVDADDPTTKKVCLDLTSMVEGATIEVLRLVVKEKGAEEEEYVIDLTEKKVFPKTHESANSLEVSHAASEEKFAVESMPCGGSITKHCGIIELPQTYGPGLDCTWTFNHEEPIEYKFDDLKVGKGDEFSIKGVKTTSKPEETKPEKGDTIKFQSGDLSDGTTKFKITFKKVGAEDPEPDPNSCKPFYFEWDEGTVASETDRKIPRRMMDDIGPTIDDDSGKKVPRIFRYAGPNKIPGTIGTPSAYSNEGLIIQQKKARSTPFNYFVIGQQAWQWFDTKKEKTKSIKADTCPYKFAEWNFKGKKYKNMKAKEASADQLEADGSCEPQQLFAVDPAAETAGSNGGTGSTTATTGETSSTGGTGSPSGSGSSGSPAGSGSPGSEGSGHSKDR